MSEGALWYEVRGIPVDGHSKAPWDMFGKNQFKSFLEEVFACSDIESTDLRKSLSRAPLVASGLDRHRV